MSERWIITPDGGRPLVLPLQQDGGAQVVGITTPSPARRVTYATRPEGATPTVREWENREITLQVALVPPRDQWASSTHDFGTPAPQAEGDGDLPGWTGNVRRVGPDGNPTTPMLSDLTATVAALAAAGGVVRRVLDDGTWLDFDVLDGELADGPTWDVTYYATGATTVTVRLTCAPFGRGRERLIGEGTKSTGQRFLTIGGLRVPGDVPALARLEYSAATTAQRWLLYAIDRETFPTQIDGGSRIVSSSGSAVAAPTGAVGGSAARLNRGIAVGQWAPLAFLRGLSGSLPAATGTVRVFARIKSVSGTPQVRLRWSPGAADGGTSMNVAVPFPAGPWCLVDLGIVTIPRDAGVVDGVIDVSGTISNFAYLDVILLVPTERSARASASADPALGGTQTAADTLSGTGALTGSSAVVGGPWVGWGSGAGSDFARTAAGATRTAAIGDCRVDALPVGGATLELSAQVVAGGLAGPNTVAFGVAIGNAAGLQALITRTGTAGAWALALDVTTGATFSGSAVPQVQLEGVNGTALTTLFTYPPFFLSPPTTGKMTLNYDAISARVGGTFDYVSVGASGVVAPSGSDQMYAGIFSRGATGSAATTFADALVTSTVANDRALHVALASEVTSAKATRQTPSGLSGALAVFRGDRPFLPPSDRDASPARVLMGTSRDDLRTGVDSTTGDTFTGRVFATPRYLQIPDQNA